MGRLTPLGIMKSLLRDSHTPLYYVAVILQDFQGPLTRRGTRIIYPHFNSTPDFSPQNQKNIHPLQYFHPRIFTPRIIHPQDYSPPGLFTPRIIHPRKIIISKWIYTFCFFPSKMNALNFVQNKSNKRLSLVCMIPT